jgi:flagellar FliL protein
MDAMADAAIPAKPKGGMGKSLMAGLLLAVTLGGGSFFAIYAGMIALPVPDRATLLAAEAEAEAIPLPVTAFVPLEQVVITLGRGANMRQLALTAQLEIEPQGAETVELLGPRIVDVMSTYLRAVDASMIEDPAAMLRMRAQLLRRIQVVTGEGIVRDLLISEFILR